MTTPDNIATMIMTREKNKAALFDLYAKKKRIDELWACYQESTPWKERAQLDSEIALLEAERQNSKVALMEMKREAQAFREQRLVTLLIAALEAKGMRDEVNKAMQQCTDALKHEGLLAAYTSNV